MTGLVLAIAALAISSLVFAALWAARRRAARAEFIRAWPLPHGLFEKLRARRPELSLKDCQLIGQALRQFFLAHLTSGRRFVSMPSRVTDELWHELILYTKLYESFCRRAFGRFLHHTPAVALGTERESNAGLRRCWWYCCKAENIDPKKPARLPLLFAIDTKLGIPGGFRYVPEQRPMATAALAEAADGAVIFYGSDFMDREFDGSTDGLGDGASGDSGGGDGGGGGCGGGGD